MRKVGLILGLALVVFACSEQAGQMLVDAGEMMRDAGETIMDGSVPDAGAQDVPVECNKSENGPSATDGSQTVRWAEFEIDPGQTEVTICREGQDGAVGIGKRAYCWRSKANWIQGTSTGFANCGTDYFDADETRIGEYPDPISITVHR